MLSTQTSSSSRTHSAALIFGAGALAGALGTLGVSLAKRLFEKSTTDDVANDSRVRVDDLEEAHPAPRRYGAAIRLKPGMYLRYRELHDAVWPEVLDRMAESNIRNFVIYYHAETSTLFQHFEWVGHWKRAARKRGDGDNRPASALLTLEEEQALFERDMEEVANDPVTRQWWKECEPCQEPFSQWLAGATLLSEGGTGPWWAPLKCVTHCGHWPVAYTGQQRDPDFVPMSPVERLAFAKPEAIQ
jgi:L-rhamnose mutarotase